MSRWSVVPDVIPQTIATIDGQLVNPFTVKATDGVFRVDTIAHALSNLCRYNGHTERFYSVAEHCLLVQLVVDVRATGLGLTPEQRAMLSFEALVHDAVEAYLGDVCAPFKKMPEFASYRQAEARLSSELRKWFGLASDEPELVRQIDVEIRGTERHWLMPESRALVEWKTAPILEWMECGTMTPQEAKHGWLTRFYDLRPDWRDGGSDKWQMNQG